MKCIGEKCPRIFESDGKLWCFEVDLPIWNDSECKLPNKIREIRDELLRKCELLETILDIDCGDNLDELIDKMDKTI